MHVSSSFRCSFFMKLTLYVLNSYDKIFVFETSGSKSKSDPQGDLSRTPSWCPTLLVNGNQLAQKTSSRPGNIPLMGRVDGVTWISSWGIDFATHKRPYTGRGWDHRPLMLASIVLSISCQFSVKLRCEVVNSP